MAGEPDSDVFRIERHGDVTILAPAQRVESLRWDLIEQAADVVVEPIRQQELPLLLVDLSEVNYFGSVFLSLLLRCWKHVSVKGGTMVLCGVSARARELLRVTALDTLWAIYQTRREAIEMLESN